MWEMKSISFVYNYISIIFGFIKAKQQETYNFYIHTYGIHSRKVNSHFSFQLVSMCCILHIFFTNTVYVYIIWFCKAFVKTTENKIIFSKTFDRTPHNIFIVLLFNTVFLFFNHLKQFFNSFGEIFIQLN